MSGTLPNSHVHTVMCSKCGRMWTGEFMAPVPEVATCKDCIAAKEGNASESKDIHINPNARR